MTTAAYSLIPRPEIFVGRGRTTRKKWVAKQAVAVYDTTVLCDILTNMNIPSLVLFSDRAWEQG